MVTKPKSHFMKDMEIPHSFYVLRGAHCLKGAHTWVPNEGEVSAVMNPSTGNPEALNLP